MKKYFNYQFLLALSISFGGCNNLLEVDDYQENFTPEEAIIGTYSTLAGIGNGTLLGGDYQIIPMLLIVPSNSTKLVDDGSYTELLKKDVKITNINTKISLNWTRSYDVINTCNNILESPDIASKPSIEGEALAIRALVHFELARLWGGAYSESKEMIPLALKPTKELTDNSSPTKARGKELFDQIKSDLIKASVLLKGKSISKGRIDYYAAIAYLARVSMTTNNFSAAALYCDTIVASGNFSLMPTPTSVYNNINHTSEDLFAINQNLSYNSDNRSGGSGLPSFFSALTESGDERFLIIPSVFGVFNFMDNLYDKRLSYQENITVNTTTDNIDSMYYKPIENAQAGFRTIGKYLKKDRVIPIIRFAEVLLTRAEATMEADFPAISERAIADLNLVRNRAGLSTLDASDFSQDLNGANALIKSIREERNREFAFEGHLLHDIRRWQADTSIAAIPTVRWDDPDLVLPIPNQETETSGLK